LSETLTVWGGYISSATDMELNPGIGADHELRLGGTGENDTIFVNGDMTVDGEVRITGDLTVNGTVFGQMAINGTTEDVFTIDTDDSTDYPTLAFEDGGVDEALVWNDIDETFELSDDLSMAGQLTVHGNSINFDNGLIIDNYETDLVRFSENLYVAGDATINGDLTILGAGVTKLVNGRWEIGDPTANVYALDPGELFVEGDVQVGGTIYAVTLSGSADVDGTISEYFIIDKGSVVEEADLFLYFSDDTDDYAHFLKWADAPDEFQLSDDVTISGELTVSDELLVTGSGTSRFSGGPVFIGDDNPSPIAQDGNDLYVKGDVEIGGSLSLGGDTTIAGVIFSDDYTEIVGSLTTGEDLDIRGRIYDGVGPDVDILDNLSISGTINSDGTGENDIEGFINLGTQTTAVNIGDLAMSGELTVGNDRISYGSGTYISDNEAATYTEISPQNDILVVRDGTADQEFRVYDSSGTDYISVDTSVNPDARIRVTGGNLLIQTENDTAQYLYFTMEDNSPYIGTVGSGLGIDTENNRVNIVDGESLSVDRDTFFVDGLNDRVSVNTLNATHDFEVTGTGRFTDDLTISGTDLHMGSNTGTIHFADESEMFSWNSALDRDTFELTDDLSVSGDLSVFGSTRLGNAPQDTFILTSSGLNIFENGTINDTDSAMRIYDDLSIIGELSVSSELEIHGSGISRFSQGRVYIGDQDPSLIAQQSGDLFVQQDVEILHDLSVGGDVTVTGNLSVQGEISVGNLQGTSSDIFEIDSDDSTDTPTLAFGDSDGDEYFRWNDNLNSAVNDGIDSFELSDDLSIAGSLTLEKEILILGSGLSRFANGRVYIGSDDPSAIARQAGDLYVAEDVEVGGSLSIGGDVSIAGVIFGDDHTEIIGSLTTGEDLDVRGRIFDGAGVEIDILDDLSVSGDLTVWDSEIYLGEQDSTNDIIRFSDNTAQIYWDDTVNDFQITDDVQIANNLTIDGQNIYLSTTSVISDNTATYTEISPQNDILAVRDDSADQEFRVYDSSGTDYISVDTSVNPDARIRVTGGNLLIQTENDTAQYLYFTMEDNSPYIGTVSSELGINTENNRVNIADGESLYVDRDTLFVDGSNNRVSVNTLSATHDFEVAGTGRFTDDLTVSGGDLYMGSNTGTIYFADETETFTWDSAPDHQAFELSDDLNITGRLTTSEVIHIGSITGAQAFNVIDSDGNVRASSLMNASNDLYVEGDIEIGGDLSLGGDVTIIGVVFSDDYTQIISPLTASDDLDVRGRIYDGGGLAVDILDSLSISGHTTINDTTFIADDISAGDSDGLLYIGKNNGSWEYIQVVDSTERFLISANVEIEDTAVSRIYFDDGTRTGEVRFDDENYGFHMDDSLSISEALTVWGGYISSDADMELNPGIGTDQLLALGGTGENDTILVNGNATIDGHLRVNGDLTVDGTIYGQMALTGTVEDVFTIDTDNSADYPALAFEDGVIDETLRWNDIDETFELSDDLSIEGQLTITGDRISFHNGLAINNYQEELLTFEGPVLIDNDTTVNGDLTILGSGPTRIINGRLEIGDPTQNTDALSPGDVYVGGNMQVAGGIYAMTISGNTDVDGTSSEYFIIDKNSSVEDIDVQLYFGDDTNDTAHSLEWNDGADEFQLSDDLTVNGEVTISNELLVTGDTTIAASLSIAKNLTISSGSIFGNGVEINLGSVTNGVVAVTGDITVSQDVTISNNLSVGGTIFGIDNLYVNVSGDTMTGPLYINPGGGVALDVDGDIEYTGELKNQSPVKAVDGLEITNFGGIKGGQILQKDILVALNGNIHVGEKDSVRTITIPKIKFVRYAEKTPVLEERTVTLTTTLSYGELSIPLAENEHVVSIKAISSQKAQDYFEVNVGLDGQVQVFGEFKLRGQRAIQFYKTEQTMQVEVAITYLCRIDTDVENVIDHIVRQKDIQIDEGWQLVYVREYALDEISIHDTAAMSPRTELSVNVVSLEKFVYSADTYIIAIIFPNNNVSQYCKINPIRQTKEE